MSELHPIILRPLKKCEKSQGGRPEFEPGHVGAEAAKLEKFSAWVPEDASSLGWGAGGSQIQWLPDAGGFTLFEWERYRQRDCFVSKRGTQARRYMLIWDMLILEVL
jgi:hypothetical protein